jgi:hypothetical protein
VEVWQLVVKYMILLGFLKNQSVAEVWQLPHFPHCEKKNIETHGCSGARPEG